jgi:hypothetical protein
MDNSKTQTSLETRYKSKTYTPLPQKNKKTKKHKKMSIMHLTNKNGGGEGVTAFHRTPACYSYSHIVPDTTKCLMAEIIYTSNSNLCIEN